MINKQFLAPEPIILFLRLKAFLYAFKTFKTPVWNENHNSFTGPLSYQNLRETEPWFLNKQQAQEWYTKWIN